MNTNHIENSLSRIRVFFEEASTLIDAIPVGQKVPATELAESVAHPHKMTGPQIYSVLKFLFDGYPGVMVKRGAQGGIYKMTVEEIAEEAAKVAATEAAAKLELLKNASA
jgi:hypothetical protein